VAVGELRAEINVDCQFWWIGRPTRSHELLKSMDEDGWREEGGRTSPSFIAIDHYLFW